MMGLYPNKPSQVDNIICQYSSPTEHQSLAYPTLIVLTTQYSEKHWQYVLYVSTVYICNCDTD